MSAKLLHLVHCNGFSMWYLVNGVGKHKSGTLKVFNAMDVTLFHTQLAYSWTSSVQQKSNLANVVLHLLANSI